VTVSVPRAAPAALDGRLAETSAGAAVRLSSSARRVRSASMAACSFRKGSGAPASRPSTMRSCRMNS
jgi:hypothetical protein